ncbi:MAG: hypothetical protein AB7N65_14470 [Vicinamibacterales bacterium]
MSVRITNWGMAALVASAVLTPATTSAAGLGRAAQAGSNAPQEQASAIPSGPQWLGTVRIPTRVLADGKPLPAGSYRVRLTERTADDKAVGARHELERWVEFVQGGQVKGQALAPVIPADAVQTVAEATPPARGRFTVQRLTRDSDDYVRLWYNLRGDQILIYLPAANASRPTGTAGTQQPQ